MGTKKKSVKNTKFEDDAAIASPSLAAATTHDDDEEANKDLSLEIVQKALLKRAINPKNDAVLVTPTKITAFEEIKSQKKRRRRKKKLESGIGNLNVNAVIVEEKEEAVEIMKAAEKIKNEAVETIEAPKKVEAAEAETGVIALSDNVVLQKKAGHFCHRCRRVGHRAKSCPDKHKGSSKSTTKCLESVNSVHDMFSCKNGFSQKAVTVEEEALGTIKAPEKIEEEPTESIKAPEKVEPAEVETAMVDVSDNVVLRKLLRGPRYFDPPSDNGWGTCYNCGEEGHAAVNCTAAKRKKPCFVCGSLEHNVKKCPTSTGKYCRSCNKVGHQAKNCPDKNKGGSKSLTICLRCGNSGHDMVSCKNDYSQDDLKEIQCYVCKKFGHLCCVNTADAIPEFSCYKCGQIGHTGLACPRLRAETTDAATPSSCYKCGEAGHFARECLSSVKANSRGKPETNDAATPSSCYKCGEEGHFSRECSSSVKASSRRQTETTGATTPSSCYKCGEEGHFSRECPSSVKASSRRQTETTGAATPSSCYKCGEEGHFSRECPSSVKASSRWQTETTGAATPTPCYKCGEEGHFARECSSFIKSGKRKRELSNTKSPRFQKENDYMGYKSAPNDTGDRPFITPQKSVHRDGWMAEHPGDRRFRTPPKSMHRDGWMAEHPGDRHFLNPQISMHRGGWMAEHPSEFTPSRFINNNWRSPVAAPPNTHIHFLSNGSHTPSSEHYRTREVHHENSYSGGSARTYNHGYAASRYDNSGSNGYERNNYRW